MHGHHLLIGIGGKRIPSVRGHEQYVVRSGVEARIPACVIRITPDTERQGMKAAGQGLRRALFPGKRQGAIRFQCNVFREKHICIVAGKRAFVKLGRSRGPVVSEFKPGNIALPVAEQACTCYNTVNDKKGRVEYVCQAYSRQLLRT